jgi:hypothetical protein
LSQEVRIATDTTHITIEPAMATMPRMEPALACV